MTYRAMLFACAFLACTPAIAAADPPPLNDPNAQDATSSGATDWGAMKAQAEAQTAAYNAAKAAADAQKSMIDAQAAAQKAQFGGVSALSGVTPGAVDAGEGPKSEALLMVTRATQLAADQLATDVQTSLGTSAYGSREFVILTSLDELSASDAVQFDAQVSLLGTELDAARDSCRAALAAAAGGGPTRTDPYRSFLPALGAVLDTGAKIASYFQTDYKFGNIAVSDPSNLTAAAVAASLRSKAGSHPLYIPANVVALDAEPVLTKLQPLQSTYTELVGLAAEAKSRSAEVKAASPQAAARLDAAEAQATKVIGQFETFLTALTTATTGKPAPITSVLRQAKLQQKMKTRPLVLLVSSAKMGGFYTRKNLWTFLAGSAPLYTMGAVSMNYTVFDPENGVVLTSGVIPVHGGYRSVAATERMFRSR